MFYFFFFFSSRRRHTRLQGDWSSDVCSSDLQFAKENIILELPGTFVTVPRKVVELVGTPPRRWTVVPRPPGDTWLPESWGQYYGVCPGCHHRAPLLTIPQMLCCPPCSEAFPVPWDQSYLRK